MEMRAVRVVALVVLSFALVGTAVADRVQKTSNGTRHCMRVTAGPDGRASGDTRSIHDFHVQVVGGTIVSHSSPLEWSGNHSPTAVDWKTTTKPIKYSAGSLHYRNGFCIRVNGGTQLIWNTTAKDGSTIAHGSINLP